MIIEAPFTNESGTISVSEGKLTLTSTQTHKGGTYDVSSNATLEFLNALTTASGAVTAMGNGDVTLNGGIYSVSDRDDTATFNLNGPQGLNLLGATVQSIGTVANKDKATFQSGVLEGGQVSVNNTVFEGGFVNTMDGTLQITGGTIGGDTFIKRITGIVQNNGTIIQDGDTSLKIEDGGAIFNLSDGTYETLGETLITFNGVAGRFENSGGLFEVSRGATPESVITATAHMRVPLNISNGGTVKVNEGTRLRLATEGDHSGSGKFDVAGTLLFESGNHTFDGNFSIEGMGETIVRAVVLASGEVVSRVKELRFRTSFSTITSTGGTLVIEDGSFNWNIGTISATDAPPDTDAVVNRGGQIVIDNLPEIAQPKLSDATLRNTGSEMKQGVVTQRGDLILNNGVIVNDENGIWRSEANSEINILGLDVDNRFVNNGGTFVKTGSNITEILIPFDLNKGTVKVEKGNLSLLRGGSSGLNEPFATGKFDIDSGAILRLHGGHRFDGIYEVTGEGTFLATDTVFAGNTFLQVSDLFTVNLTGPGKAIIAGDGLFTSDGGILINKGNAEWHGGNLATMRNDPTGRLKIVDGGTEAVAKAMTGNIDNQGVIDHALGQTVDISRVSGLQLTNTGIYNLHGKLTIVTPMPAEGAMTFRNQLGGQFRLAEPNVQRTYEGKFINMGSVVVEDGSTLRLLDAPDNLRILNGDPSGLLANGRWEVKANANLTLGGVNAGKLLRNEANILLRGNGRITNLPDADAGDDDLDFENAGTFSLHESTIFRAPGDFVNADEGTLEIDATSALFIAGDFASQSGSTTVINNLLNAQGSFINDGGSFSGSGMVVTTNFANISGSINPGNSPGTLTLNSSYTQSSSAGLIMEIAGLIGESEHDVLVVNGDASLAGDITFRFIDGFAPAMGQTFDLIEVSGVVTGGFDTFTVENLLPGFLFDTQFNGGVFTLTALNDGQFIPEPTSAVVLGLMALAAWRRPRRDC